MMKMLQHYQVNYSILFKFKSIIYSIFIELGSKISSFFSSRKDETNNTTNTTDEDIPTVRKIIFFLFKKEYLFFLE